jgi:hypothetical protein
MYAPFISCRFPAHGLACCWRTWLTITAAETQLLRSDAVCSRSAINMVISGVGDMTSE